MGLDFVDILFRIEDTFQIRLDEEDLRPLISGGDLVAGDLYQLILEKRHLQDFGRHDLQLNRRLWEEVRTAVHFVGDTPLRMVELRTPLEELFPRSDRAARWKLLQDVCPYRIRELDYPPYVRYAGVAIAVAVVAAELFQVGKLIGLAWVWAALGALGIWLVVETYLKVLSVLKPFRTAFPPGFSTVKDLCRTVLSANYAEICRDTIEGYAPESAETWHQLTEILSASLGSARETISFHTRLVRELGMS